MAFPEIFLRELIERSDIVDVVSQYVKLTKRTGGNIFGLCPFHSEKTPSFAVRPDMQSFHCFGCGKGGSAVGFIMEIENLSYPDAVRFLARRAGLTVPEQAPDEFARKRGRMLLLNTEAARFFHSSLTADGGREAREYIKRRAIPRKMVKAFGIGYAPDSWDALRTAMQGAGFTESELADAGLVKRGRQGGTYDTFRNRLMFPVIDVRGDVIGFSGRLLGDGEPKYLNSPETAVFSKSRNLFALNLAKKAKSGYIILSEGNIDVVALHGAGFDSAVASLGTSLTKEQARLLFRYTKSVVLAFDADEAGRRASERASGLLEDAGLEVRVLALGGAKDPDEFIKLYGADAFRNLLERSETHAEFSLSAIAAKHNLAESEGKVAYLREATEAVAKMPGLIEREVYGMRVAQAAGVSPEAVAGEISRARKKLAAGEMRQAERSASSPARLAQPKARELRYGDVRSAAAEEGLIRLMFQDPGLFRVRADVPGAEDFSSELLGRIFTELGRRDREGRGVSLPALEESFSPDEISHLTAILQKPERTADRERAITDYIEIIRSGALLRDKENFDLLKYRDALAEKMGVVKKDER